MSKLNLIRLTKDEITREEAQKARGGITACICPCICLCACSGEAFVSLHEIEVQYLKVDTKQVVLAP